MPQIDVRINSMYPPGTQGGTRAYASATIDGCFAVRGIKLVEGGKDGLFVSMPSRRPRLLQEKKGKKRTRPICPAIRTGVRLGNRGYR